MKLGILRVFVFVAIIMQVELRRGFMDDLLKKIFCECMADTEQTITNGEFFSSLPETISQRSQSIAMKEKKCLAQSDEVVFIQEVLFNCGVEIVVDVTNAIFKVITSLSPNYQKETKKEKKLYVDEELGKSFECKAENTLDYANEVVAKEFEGENIRDKDKLCQKSIEEAKYVLIEIKRFQMEYFNAITPSSKNQYLYLLQKFIDEHAQNGQFIVTHLLKIEDAPPVLEELYLHFNNASLVICDQSRKLPSGIVTFLKKGYAVFKFLFYCFADIKGIIKQGIKELVKFLLNLLSAGVLKTLGIVVLLVKIVYYIYKHSNSKTSGNKMKYMGKIVGSLIRVFLELINFPGLISPIWKPSQSDSDSESESDSGSSERSSIRSSINRESIGFDFNFKKKLRRNK